jgi:hypothetical protein
VSPLFPILLAVHIALAISLLLPAILLPFLLRGRAAETEGPAPPIRALLSLQASGSLVIGLGLALTGAALVLLLGVELLGRPWLIVALALYAANLLVAAFIARPGLLRLIRIPVGDPDVWRRRARRQRWLAYAMAAVIGVIGFLMATKPQF